MSMTSEQVQQIKKIADESKLTELFTNRDSFQNEIKARSQQVLKAMGYDWYKLHSINAVLSMRGKVQLVTIDAHVEHNFQDEQYHAEMPVTQFEMLLQTDFASE